jgi:Cu-Zn family superoxide dismutase
MRQRSPFGRPRTANGFAAFAALVLCLAADHSAAGDDEATAELRNAAGSGIGSVTLRQTPQGTLLHARLHGLPPGPHGFHVHAVGSCEPPFQSAGGHYNPDETKHGMLSEQGMHAGDMPNLHVGESGAIEVEVLNTLLDLDDSLFDADGAAIVIHRNPDDYTTDPHGNAGERIACGVIRR